MYPILITAYKRPNHLKNLIDSLRDIKPKKIFFACDGPKKNNENEYELVELTKKQIEFIDWGCEVHTRFSNSNKGCCKGMSEAISWFFDYVEAGIILEEDCIPHEDFISYCSELLDKYALDKRVWSISGTNFQDGKWRGENSYYFSRYFQCWGWATWKRSWEEFDIAMNSWLNLRDSEIINYIFDNKTELIYWMKLWDKLTFENIPDSWAYRFSFISIINGGLSVIPNKNLIKNIGFDKYASNTHETVEITSIEKSILPLSHPSFVIRHKDADKYVFNTRFSLFSLKKLLLLSFKRPLYYPKKIFKIIFK